MWLFSTNEEHSQNVNNGTVVFNTLINPSTVGSCNVLVNRGLRKLYFEEVEIEENEPKETELIKSSKTSGNGFQVTCGFLKISEQDQQCTKSFFQEIPEHSLPLYIVFGSLKVFC
ncbi:MAG: hypothetical protein IPL23_19825 [Saprospiraceae bacterium]|nr:hypothetical protein [Saprospiraceae bacterium]MBK8634101.1 hypothetical protein [Saprospiraceae bacterium]